MEAFANELSIENNVFDNYQNIKNLFDVYTGLKNNGISTCRISPDNLMKIIEYIDPGKRDLLNFVFSFFRAPYEGNEGVMNNEEEYYEHQWSYDGDGCFGLALAYLTDSISVSFSAEKWNETVEIKRDSSTVKVRNVSSGKHILCHAEWFETIKEIKTIFTQIPYNEKQIHLRDDHGKDVLQDFSKKICKSPYVCGVINSLPFNCKEKRFIRKIKANGIIEIVLCWTDEGFGIALQTTGRNLRETEYIARILQEEYAR